MPIFDFYCECGEEQEDVYLRNAEDEVLCTKCNKPMEKRPPNFSFSLTPGAITRFKSKFGKRPPAEYKTSGGANIYGVPRKS